MTETTAPTSQPAGPSLYQLGAWGGLAAVAIAIVQVIIEIIGVGFGGVPVPTTVEGWFALIQSNRLLGLTELTGLQIPMFVLLVPLYLALYVSLRPARPGVVLAVTAFALIGIGVYLASNTALSMLALSDQWAVAATDADRSTLVAAGQAMLAVYEGPGLDAGVFLVMGSTLGLSWVMLKTLPFGRVGPAAGIVAGVVCLGYYLALFVPSARIFLLEASGLFYLVWVALAARSVQRLGAPAGDWWRSPNREPAQP